MKPTIAILLILLLAGCSSKKKLSETTKTETHEKKDLSVFATNNELSVITFTKDASEMIVEPNMPDKPLIIGKDTIYNAKIVKYRKQKVDSSATSSKNTTVQMSDKGEVNGSTKSKKSDKDVEAHTGDIKWTVWGVALIVIVLLGVGVYGKVKKWF